MGVYLGPFRISKRGVRVRVGPRIARLHVGAGGTGISTGAGPFTAYQSLGGKKRRPARRAEAVRPRAATAPLSRRADQYDPGYATERVPRRWLNWPGWTAIAGAAVMVLSFVLAGVGGANPNDTASEWAGGLVFIALVAVLVALVGAVARRVRRSRETVAAAPPAPPSANWEAEGRSSFYDRRPAPQMFPEGPVFSAMAATPSGAAPTDTEPDEPARRLRKIQDLREAGLISLDEYNAKRAAIIDSI